MISFQKMSIIDRIMNLYPPLRKRNDADTRTAIKYLVGHPEEPCVISNHFIPNGYGDTDLSRCLFGFERNTQYGYDDINTP
jgi:hypothetical protein